MYRGSYRGSNSRSCGSSSGDNMQHPSNRSANRRTNSHRDICRASFLRIVPSKATSPRVCGYVTLRSVSILKDVAKQARPFAVVRRPIGTGILGNCPCSRDRRRRGLRERDVRAGMCAPEGNVPSGSCFSNAPIDGDGVRRQPPPQCLSRAVRNGCRRLMTPTGSHGVIVGVARISSGNA